MAADECAAGEWSPCRGVCVPGSASPSGRSGAGGRWLGPRTRRARGRGRTATRVERLRSPRCAARGRGALRVRVRRPAPGDPYSLVEALGPCAPPMIGRRVVPLRNGRRTDRVFGLCVSALLVTRYCLRTTSCHVCVYQCACIIVSLDVRRLTNFQSCFPSGIGVSVRFVRVRFA